MSYAPAKRRPWGMKPVIGLGVAGPEVDRRLGRPWLRPRGGPFKVARRSASDDAHATVVGGIQSRARRRNCRHSNSAPTGPEAPAKAGSSGPTKMQELAGNGSPPSTAASPVSTSQNWPPPALGACPAIAVQGGIR